MGIHTHKQNTNPLGDCAIYSETYSTHESAEGLVAPVAPVV